MTLELLLPFALNRKLSAAQLEDLVHRAVKDPRFDLSAVTDEFAGFMNREQATDWAIELERTGSAAHVFSQQGAATSTEEAFGGIPMSKIKEMSAEERLRLANKVDDEKRRDGKKH